MASRTPSKHHSWMGCGAETRRLSFRRCLAPWRLIIALKANTAHTLPVFLTAAYAAHQGIKVNTVVENINGVGSAKSTAELVTDAGEKLVGAEIPRFFLKLSGQGKPTTRFASHLALLRGWLFFTLADVVIWGMLRGDRVIVGLRRNNQNADRCFNFIEARYSWLPEAVASFVQNKPNGVNYNFGLKNTENGIYGDRRGVLICRFADAPSKESQEFQGSILHDLSLLGVVPDRILYSSNYFQQVYDACVALIKSGKAYADNTWCVRAKISVDDVNKSLRSPVIYRCNYDQSYHRTGKTWKIYPTYGLCAPYLDSLEKCHWIQHALGLRQAEIWDFSRLNFIRTVLSKRKLTTIVDEGANIVNMDWSQFWAVNKKYIDPIAARHTAIPKQDAMTAYIEGIEETSSVQKPKHNKNSELGTKEVVMGKEILISQEDAQSFRDNEVITLMNWGNAIVLNKTTTTNPQPPKNITTLHLKLDLESDPKKTKKITWLAKEPRNMVPVELYSFDHLITKDKHERTDDLSSVLSKPSAICTEAWADCNVVNLAANEIIQFDRTGFFRVERAYSEGEGRLLVLFNIPTGKAA
ncbi:ribosomal protein L25/Gln-tRNA synthetase [Aspergillus undulatus]|uniref:ribosomal protein L25/Gln-tRNA synthetase n=1 Tax=Aspergillus undulatus TaxID=1810928 RepID=UPI003CCE21F6